MDNPPGAHGIVDAMTTAMPPTPERPEPALHPDHDRGLEFDVRTLLARRSALGLISGAGLLALVGCSDGTASGGTTGTAAVDSTVPDETARSLPGRRQQRRRRARRLGHRAAGHPLLASAPPRRRLQAPR